MNGQCVLSCPEKYYPSSYLSDNKNVEELEYSTNVCLPCHYSCHECHGSNDYECLSCYPDASLIQHNSEESYCYPKAIISSIQSEEWYFRACVLLWVILILFVLFAAFYLARLRSIGSDVKDEAMQFKTLRKIRKIERDIQTSVYSDSD